MHLKAALPGIGLDRVFEVPVFATIEPQLARQKPRSVEKTSSPELPRRIVRVSRTTEGLRLDYPASRNRGLGLAVFISGLFFLGIVLVMGLGTWDWPSPAGNASALAAALRGFLLLVIGAAGLSLVLSGLYLLTNSLQVLVGRHHLATRRRLLGIPIQLRQVSGDEVTGLHHAIAWQLGQGARAPVPYALFATLADGRRVSLGDGLNGKFLADKLLGMVREACQWPNKQRPDIMGDSLGDSETSQDVPTTGHSRVRWVAALVGVLTIGASIYELFKLLPG